MAEPLTIVSMPPRRTRKGKVARKPLKATPTPKKPKKRKIKRSNLVKKLDQVFSLWLRLLFADKDGVVACYTCPNKMHYKKAQNSHYVSRSVRSLRWSEDNCRPACYGCNVMHGGNLITYRENLVKELGEESVLALEQARHVLFKPSEEWLLEKIADYEARIKALSSYKEVIHT